jgi:hypothetical protein
MAGPLATNVRQVDGKLSIVLVVSLCRSVVPLVSRRHHRIGRFGAWLKFDRDESADIAVHRPNLQQYPHSHRDLTVGCG